METRLTRVLVAFCCAGAVLLMPSAVLPEQAGASPASGQCAPDASWGRLSRSFAADVLALVNKHRSAMALRPLVASPSLMAAAEWKSLHMAGARYFAHADPAPPVARGVGERLLACGYPAQSTGWGENIAYGQPTPRAVMSAWLQSPGHRANIESRSFRALGVGVARSEAGLLFWTQDFGTSRSGAAA
jgi:uncharacterized protein YkwD